MRSLVTSIVLVGPPASGKSTIREIIEGFGAVGTTVDDESYEDDVLDTLDQTIDSSPYVAVFDGATSQEVVDYIRDVSGDTLVVAVEVSSDRDRIERFIDREVDRSLEPITQEEMESLHEVVLRREFEQRPYPQYDVMIKNDESDKIITQTMRMASLVAAVSERSPEDFIDPEVY